MGTHDYCEGCNQRFAPIDQQSCWGCRDGDCNTSKRKQKINKKLGERVKEFLRGPLPIHRHSDNPEFYFTPCALAHVELMRTETIGYISILESTTRQVSKALCYKENATAAEIIAVFNQVKLERDAAMALIPRACAYCKWYGAKHGGFFPDCKNPSGCRNISGINTGWEWRGVQKEDNHA